MPDDLFRDDAPRNSTRSDGAAGDGGAAADGGAAGESAGLDADRAVTVICGTQYHSLVRLAALLIGEVNAAEDVVQESFVDMHSAWSRLGDTESAVSFLRQAVASRSRAILPHPTPPHPTPPPATPSPAAPPPSARPPSARPCPAAAAESAAIRAIRALPVPQREALVLRLYLELTEEQVAAAMGISPSTVQDHTASGMAALRAVL